MRILTVRQPWAWAIIHGGKDVENRVRNIAGGYRGPVAIHVAQADAETAPEGLWLSHANWYRARSENPQPSKFQPAFWDRGAVIGVVDLVDVHAPVPGEGAVRGDTCSPWAEPDVWHLVLENPRALPEPIPYMGALGLRHLSPEAILAIVRQIGAVT